MKANISSRQRQWKFIFRQMCAKIWMGTSNAGKYGWKPLHIWANSGEWVKVPQDGSNRHERRRASFPDSPPGRAQSPPNLLPILITIIMTSIMMMMIFRWSGRVLTFPYLPAISPQIASNPLLLTLSDHLQSLFDLFSILSNLPVSSFDTCHNSFSPIL